MTNKTRYYRITSRDLVISERASYTDVLDLCKRAEREGNCRRVGLGEEDANGRCDLEPSDGENSYGSFLIEPLDDINERSITVIL